MPNLKPYQDVLCISLRGHILAGRPAAAVAQYEQYAKWLKNEFEAEPHHRGHPRIPSRQAWSQLDFLCLTKFREALPSVLKIAHN